MIGRHHFENRAWPAGVVAMAILLVTIGLTGPPWFSQLVAFAMARGIAALGVFLLWRCGLVSFGHALFFGIGAYAVAFGEIAFGLHDLFLRLCAGLLAAATVGLLLSPIIRRYRGISFALLNLAFSMVLYGIVIRSPAFGTTDGFSIGRSTVFGAPLKGAMSVYWVLLGVTVVTLLIMQLYRTSVAGALAVAVRDNELRTEFLGLSADRFIGLNYIASAALTGLGGSFAAILLGQVDPDSMVGWAFSGELVFITVLAGNVSATAVVVVSIMFELIRSYALEWAPRSWQLLFGMCLMLSIVWRPQGLWPLRSREAK